MNKQPSQKINRYTSKSKIVNQVFAVLEDIDKNIDLFKKTRQELKEKYPKTFPSSYEHH